MDTLHDIALIVTVMYNMTVVAYFTLLCAGAQKENHFSWVGTGLRVDSLG